MSGSYDYVEIRPTRFLGSGLALRVEVGTPEAVACQSEARNTSVERASAESSTKADRTILPSCSVKRPAIRMSALDRGRARLVAGRVCATTCVWVRHYL